MTAPTIADIDSKTLLTDEDTFYTCDVSSHVYVGDYYEEPLQSHFVTFKAANEELGVEREIGNAHLYSFCGDADTEGRGVFDILDAESENLMHIGSAMCYGKGAQRMDDDFPFHDNLVFVSFVNLLPEYRGFGIGPYLVSRTLRASFRMYDAVLLQAFPLNAADMSEDAIKTTQRKIAKAWKSIGFKKLADDVYIAPLSRITESKAAEKRRKSLTNGL